MSTLTIVSITISSVAATVCFVMTGINLGCRKWLEAGITFAFALLNLTMAYLNVR